MDVFSLDYVLKRCKCRESYGQYAQNALHAVISGPCTPLGFANRSFQNALGNQPSEGMGEEFKAFVIPKECETVFHRQTVDELRTHIRLLNSVFI